MLNNFGLGILISAKDKASMVFDRVDQKLTGLARTSEETQKKLQAASAAFGVGISSLGAGIATLGGLAGTAKVAADFQTGMVGVQKTTGMAGVEIKGLKNELLKLSTQMPQSAKDLASISEVGGQLGIQGKDNLLAFTEATAKLTQVSEFSAETGGEAMAKLANQFKLPISQAERIGSVLNELSNVSTATAVDVADLSNRMAGAGHTLGLTFPQVAALGAALKDLGVNNEVAGTAMSDVFLEMMKRTEAFGKVAGMTGEQFKNLINRDAAGALISFLKGLSGFDKFQVSGMLGDLGIGGTRGADVLLKMSEATKSQNGAMSLLESRMATAGTAFSKNTSLNTEYNTGLQALNAQLDILKNNFSAVAISVGDVLIPPLTRAAEAVSGFVRSLVEWTQKNPELTKGIVALVAAFGGLATVGGTILTVVGALGMMGTALGGLPAATAALTALAPAIAPIAVGLVAAAAAGAALAVAWKEDFGGLKTTVLPFLEEIKTGIGSVVEVVKAAITLLQGGSLGKELEASLNTKGLMEAAQGVANVMKGIVEGVKGFIEGFATSLGPAVKDLLQSLREGLKAVAPVVKNLFAAFGGGGEKITGTSQAIGQFLGAFAGTATVGIKAAAVGVKVLVGAFKILVALGEGIGAAAFHVVNFFEKVGAALGEVPQRVKALFAFFKNGAGLIQGFAQKLGGVSLDGVSKLGEAFKGLASGGGELAAMFGDQALGGVTRLLDTLSSLGGEKLKAVRENLSALGQTLGAKAGDMQDAAAEKLGDVQQLATALADKIGPALTGQMGSLKESFSGIGGALSTALSGLKASITGAFGGVGDAVKTKMGEISGAVKTGVDTLTGVWATFKATVYQIWDEILKKITGIFGKIREKAVGLVPEPVRNLVGAVQEKLGSLLPGKKPPVTAKVPTVKTAKAKKFATGGFVSRTGLVNATLHRGEVITPEPTVRKLVALADRLDRLPGGGTTQTHNAPVTNNIHVSLPGVRDLKRENLDELAAVIAQKLQRLQERQREAAFGNDFGPTFLGVTG